MSYNTTAQTCADIDELHRRISELTADNGALRAQQHDLIRARDAACADARMLRGELETAKNELHTARALAERRGW